MRLMTLTVTLAVLALSGAGPALAADTCNGGSDPCKVGDCLGGDVLTRHGHWTASDACKMSAAPGGASRFASGASGGGTTGSGPAAISDQAAAGNLTSFLPTAQSDRACRAPMVGVLSPVAKGCRIPVGQESWCSAGGGQIASNGGKQFCLPKGAGGR